MKVRVISGCGILEYAKRAEQMQAKELGCDIAVFPLQDLCVRYEKELKGESNYFEQAALLSKRLQATVICGCETDTRGHMRKSAIVACDGRIVGVSDMTHAVDGEASSGATLCVYETAVGKVGVVVAGDLQSYEVVKALALCGSDVLVCVQEQPTPVYEILARAWAYCLGLPILVSANGYACAADESGAVLCSSLQETVQINIQPQKEFHIVQTRRRGKRLMG